jgi:transport family protein 27
MSAVSSPAAPLRLRCKVLLLGESTVGKTSICQTYCSNGTEFPKNYLMTICCDLQVKVVQIPDSTVSVELFIYDCSGQDIFRDQLAQVLDGACAVVYVYDVTRRETFEQLFQWVRLVADARKGLKPLKGTVVANKLDVQVTFLLAPLPRA